MRHDSSIRKVTTQIKGQERWEFFCYRMGRELTVFYPMDIGGSLLRGKDRRIVKLMTHLHIVRRLRVSGDLPLCPSISQCRGA
jgi:hypothetical protein